MLRQHRREWLIEITQAPSFFYLTKAGTLRTAGFFDYFFGAEVTADEAEELIAFDSQVGSEDRALVESVQRGVGTSLLTEGRLLPESEKLIAHFQALAQSYE